MGATIKTIFTLLFAFVWSISAQQVDGVTVLANSTQLVVSQDGVPLTQGYLYSQPYAGYYPQSCGGVLKLNSTVDTAATLIFVGTAIEIVYVLFPTGGNGMVYLDGQYQGDIDSYSVDASCTTSISSLTNLTPKSHNLTIINKDVLTGTAIYGLVYTPATPSTVKSKTSKGPIIGGVVAGILIFALLIFVLWRRRSRQSNPPNPAPTGFNPPFPAPAGFNPPVPPPAGFNPAAPPVTYGQEPKKEDYAPHNPPSLGYAGYTPSFPNPTPASPTPFDANSINNNASNDQRRYSIGSSSSPVSHVFPPNHHPAPPRGALPAIPLPAPQYLDQIQPQQQQQQYRPESVASRPMSNPSHVDLVQRLVHTGVPAAEVVRMMGEAAAAGGSPSGGGRGSAAHVVDEQPPPQYGDEKGGLRNAVSN
ncbi:hypothetical protein FRB94_008355 [Tulasnella sp. JGI-2019a]|nr:hypothetical protein FRB94_008355 [Tulasnella sp. JGI-2019a]